MIYDIDGHGLISAYDVEANALVNAYNLEGQNVWTGMHHDVSNNYTASLIYDVSAIYSGTQGIACDSLSQEIAQLYSGKIITVKLSDGSYTQRASFNLGHGSAGRFEPQKKSVSDLYPPLWVSPQSEKTINGNVYAVFVEIYVGESSSTTNRAFYVPFDGQEEGDGFTLFGFDFANGLVYAVYFSGYYDTTGTSKVTVYRLSDFTSFSGGTWSPTPANGHWLAGTPVDTFAIDFVPECQSLTFFDGMLCLLGDYPHNSGKVVFIDIETHLVYLTIENLVVPFEREGIDFILNQSTNKYDMILSRRTTGVNEYYRYQFS